MREKGKPSGGDPLAGSSKRYPNPIAGTQEWQRMLSAGERASRADLSRRLGMTRARVAQVLSLLDLAPEVLEVLAALGDPLPKPIVTERGLRSLLNLSIEEQKRGLEVVASKVGAS